MVTYFPSLLLNSDGSFIHLNPNILETNVQNLVILIGILVYAYNVSFKDALLDREIRIVRTIGIAFSDLLNAFTFYCKSERGSLQNILWLQSWRACDMII